MTLTDCVNDPILTTQSKTTKIDVGAEDLTIACALAPIGGTERLAVRAGTITVLGPAGWIEVAGRGPSLRLTAAGQIALRRTAIEATKGNATVFLEALAGIDVEDTRLALGDGVTAGRLLALECTGAGCPIRLAGATLEGNAIKVIAQGPIDGAPVTFATRGPRDRLEIRSLGDDVRLGTAAGVGAGGGAAADKCNGVGGGGGGGAGGNEARAIVAAAGDVVLDGFTIRVGQFIDVIACGTVSLRSATLRNDHGKRGDIVVTAAGGAGQVDIEGATLIDDDDKRAPDVSEINGRETLPHTGFNNVVGTPTLDT